MKININEITQMVNEVVRRLTEDRGSRVFATIFVDLDYLVDRIYDEELKETIYNDESLYNYLKSIINRKYKLSLVGDHYYDRGNYFNEPQDRIDNIKVIDDDGIFKDIEQIENEEIKSCFYDLLDSDLEVNDEIDWEEDY